MSDFNKYLLSTVIGIVSGGIIGGLFGEAGLGLSFGGPVGIFIALLRVQGRKGR